MSARSFDKKFGEDFLTKLPSAPGVYRCFDEGGKLVYVGKAVDLRRRLAQYRNASRKKAHRKMRRIVRASARIEVEVTVDERAALLLEDALIKEHRPRLNVAGAYAFMYPFVGVMRSEDRDLHLAYTTDVEPLESEGFRPFGCYRNRNIARAGFDALVAILGRAGHAEDPPKHLDYTAWRRFRQVPSDWDGELTDFLAGDSDGLLEVVVMALLESPSARRDAAEVQRELRTLKRFHERECVRLAALTCELGEPFVSQEERDATEIRARGAT